MKRLFILLTLGCLAFTSCLNTEDDLFDLSPSERVELIQNETQDILESAENGWVVEYFAGEQFGGSVMLMSFNEKREVTMATTFGEVDETATSLYSYKSDAGALISFDTYNRLFNDFISPDSGYGETGTGMGGDFEFSIMSYEKDHVVLRGKRNRFIVEMTPVPAGTTWADYLTTYRAKRAQMDGFVALELLVGSKSYYATRSGNASFHDSSVLTLFHSEGNVFDVPYIFTNSGIKFAAPITVDGVEISKLDWANGSFTDDVTNVELRDVQISSSNYSLSVSNIGVMNADVKVASTGAKGFYYCDVATKEAYELYGSKGVMAESMKGLDKTMLSSGAMTFNFDHMVLKPETEYVTYAYGVEISDLGAIIPVSDITVKEFATDSQPEASAEYSKWLGVWNTTSTSAVDSGEAVSFDIRIEPMVNNERYYIYGLDPSMIRDEIAIIANFNEATGAFEICNDVSVCYYQGLEVVQLALVNAECFDPTYTSILWGRDEEGGEKMVSLTSTLNEDGTATMKGAEIRITGGNAVVNTVVLFGCEGEDIYGFFSDPQFSGAGDFVGPYSMEKAEDVASAPQRAMGAGSSTGVALRQENAVVNNDYSSFAKRYLTPSMRSILGL